MNIKFEELSGKNIKIGLIDTGINKNNSVNICNSYKGNFNDYTDYIGHGTIVAQIINKLAPSSNLYNIKVFDKNSYTSPQMVLNGIDWAIKNKLDIINLSLGTKDLFFYNDFKRIIKKAEQNNCFIVSAISNDYSFSLPSILDNVISVGSSNNSIEDKYGYYFIRHKYIQCIADGGQFGNTFLDRETNSKNKTSYATPIITSIIALILQVHKSIGYHQLLKILAFNSLKNKPNLDYIFSKIKYNTLLEKYETDFLDNKIIKNSKKVFYFPLMDESYFFNNFKDLMSVEISHYNGNDTSYADYDLFVIGKSVQNLDDKKIEVLEKLLFYAFNIRRPIFSLITRKELSILITNKEIVKQKNIIFINDYIKLFIKNTIQITPNNKTPILTLIDLTQNKYNLFEIQLLIRRFFLSNKLNFIQISSIIHSNLFGLDFVLNYELLKNELFISDFIPFISYVNYFFSSKKNQDLVFYSFETSPFLSTQDMVDANQNNKAMFTFTCLNTIQPDAFVLIIDLNCNITLLDKNIDSIISNYNPDFIIILMNKIFSYESNMHDIKDIYSLINKKNNNPDCEIFILSLNEEEFEKKIYSTLIKHYK